MGLTTKELQKALSAAKQIRTTVVGLGLGGAALGVKGLDAPTTPQDWFEYLIIAAIIILGFFSADGANGKSGDGASS